MKIEDLENYIALFREWIEQKAVPLLQDENASRLDSWRKELSSAERLLDERPELPIAFLGPSQQGKSSLINAIVGETVLPVGYRPSAEIILPWAAIPPIQSFHF